MSIEIQLPFFHFVALFPRCKKPGPFVDQLNHFFPQYKINSETRISAFLAQTGHESAGYTVFKENLNYSAKALNTVFPKYFKNAGIDAEKYHRQPEKIANRVYANRMGNGGEESGDGWKYRGRGIIQLTGKSNYQAFSNDTGTDIVDRPDIILDDTDLLIQTALWFWNKNNLNKYIDEGDFTRLTKRINGGTHGLSHRTDLYNRSLELWR